MLNQGIESITSSSSQPSDSASKLFHLTLNGVPETIKCKLIVSSKDFSRYLPNTSVKPSQVSEEQEITAYGVVVVKTSISLNSFSDNATSDGENSPDETEKRYSVIGAWSLSEPAKWHAV